jgi:Uma2 family endonuclease
MTALILNLRPAIDLTDEQFFQLCQNNRDLRLERTAKGELIIMPPTGWESGNRNAKLTARLEIWTEADGTGLAFDSSTGFKHCGNLSASGFSKSKPFYKSVSTTN